jgi:lysyl-tRNA synthetase class 2
MSKAWLPSASISTLQQRAQIMASIRQFFYERSVLEVETPSLSHATITDPHLSALSTKHTEPGASTSNTLYLQTSPEYAMKRLLAARSGDIFQLCKSFRDDEVGAHHNPEFTMLEWYRLGFSMQDLINEVGELLIQILPISKVEQFTYSELFEQYCNFSPLTASVDTILSCCKQVGLASYIASIEQQLTLQQSSQALQGEQAILLKDSALQVLFNQEIEPHIGQEIPAVVSHFPASQAALATLADDGLSAHRFEVYFKGLELANGFNELQDAAIQKQRFLADNEKRKTLGLPVKEIDAHFMSALEAGLPACSGVALGVDRLIMLALNKQNIKEVLSFNYDNC